MEHGKQWTNRLLVTDTQQQVAASRHMPRSGQLKRYTSQ